MRKELCLCEEIRLCRARLRLATSVTVIMHHRERHLPTNTARLARLCLESCTVQTRGLPNTSLDLTAFSDESRHQLFLYPAEDAQILSPQYLSRIDKPINLIVPDGSWRQAAKVSRREPALQNIPRVILPQGELSAYHLRREPKAHGLATFEAIARALGIIEGPHVHTQLDHVFKLMVKRTLQSRGTTHKFVQGYGLNEKVLTESAVG